MRGLKLAAQGRTSFSPRRVLCGACNKAALSVFLSLARGFGRVKFVCVCANSVSTQKERKRKDTSEYINFTLCISSTARKKKKRPTVSSHLCSVTVQHVCPLGSLVSSAPTSVKCVCAKCTCEESRSLSARVSDCVTTHPISRKRKITQ